jgi:hypothetical protein
MSFLVKRDVMSSIRRQFIHDIHPFDATSHEPQS